MSITKILKRRINKRQKKRFTLTVSVILAIVMLFGTVSVAAADDTYTTAPAFDDVYSEDYQQGYDDGYAAGYGDGYYDGLNDAEDTPALENFRNIVEELYYKVLEFIENLKDFLKGYFGGVEDDTEAALPSPDDYFIPDGSQDTLENDLYAAVLCAEFNSLIENAMEVTEPVTVTKTVEVDVEAQDMPSAVASIVNPLIEQFTGETTVENEYEAGDYVGMLQETGLYPAGLVSAEKTVNKDGTTDYSFILAEEVAFYNGESTYGITLVDGEVVETELQHEYVADAIYIETADIAPAKIIQAYIYYPGATITATTDAKGRLIAYDIDMPVEGAGTGTVGFIDVTVVLEGYRNEGFVLSYAN